MRFNTGNSIQMAALVLALSCSGIAHSQALSGRGTAFAMAEAAAPPQGPPPPPRHGGPGGPGGQWWDNPETAQKIGLTAEQEQKVRTILASHRSSLFDLSQRVQKEDFAMETLMDADTLDENAVVAQADRVADARAQMEKARVRMLVELRRVLTIDQWHKLQALQPPPGRGRGPGHGADRGPDRNPDRGPDQGLPPRN